MSTQKSGSSGITSALGEAQKIIEAAEKRASELRNSAERAFEEARALGFKEGYKRGVAEAVDTAIRLLEDSGNIEAQLAEEAAKLAMAICSNVIGEQVKVDAQLVKKIAERALKQSIVGENITIFIHPEDKTVVSNSLDHLRRIAGGAQITLEVDPSIDRGGCLVKTQFGEVDASIESLLESVASKLGLKK